MVQGAFDQAYEFENFRLRTSKADIDIPIGFWRSVGHSCNAYYLETFLDEIAVKSKQDPLDLRLNLLKHHHEAIGVLNKVAEMSNWKTTTKPGHGKGLAFHLSFGAWVAQVIEVSDSSDGIKLENIWCACDLGTVVDPAIVKTQMQSGIIYGLSAAMDQEITFADGMACKVPQEDAMEIIWNGCERIVRVSEQQIRDAIVALYQDTHNIAEGAGAAAFAALMSERDLIANKRVGIILSGGNIDLELLQLVLSDAL